MRRSELMALMEWTEKLSVGVGQFDEEHKRLIGLLNELAEAMSTGHGKQALGPILDALIVYTKTHFDNEERLMKLRGYPEYEAHKKEHDALNKQVLDVRAKFQAGATSALSIELMTFLKSWLSKHILGTDQKYTAFFNAKAVPAAGARP
jgi:hemerythrin